MELANFELVAHVQNVQVSDTTGDATKNYCRLNNFHSNLLNPVNQVSDIIPPLHFSQGYVAYLHRNLLRHLYNMPATATELC